MILKKELTMRNLKKSHGVNLIKYKLGENETDLSKILIKIEGKGTFSELFKFGLFDWSLPEHLNAAADLSKQSPGYKDKEDKASFINCCVRLKDLLSVIPEIYVDFIKSYEEHPNIFSGLHKYWWKGENVEKVELFIDKRTPGVTKEFILKKLPMLGKGYDVEEKERYFKFTCTPHKDAPGICEDMYEETFLKSMLQVFKGKTLQSFDKELGLLDIEAHFLIMFALSILSRYELKLWYRLMVDKKGTLVKKYV